LVQTIGRAARNADGHVIIYADTITESMRFAVDETNRRRSVQDAYNKAHGITPQSIRKEVRDLIRISKKADKITNKLEKDYESMSTHELEELIAKLSKKMHTAAAELNFEKAAELRDEIAKIREYKDR
ncbi:MAG: UvrB/UvrC motif-containing protein, partial [Lachnospiraceae bacterium]|nr:UvrB/UvrC motif-containing protein [Lachnospiraceae bacterium]